MGETDTVVQQERVDDAEILRITVPEKAEAIQIAPESGDWAPPLRVRLRPLHSDPDIKKAKQTARDGNAEQAVGALRSLAAERQGSDRARVLSALARQLRSAGKLQEAVQTFVDAEKAHLAAGNMSAAAYDAVGRAWTQGRYMGQLNAARTSLEAALARETIDGRVSAQLGYHLALVERDSLAWRRTHELLEAAEAQASALGLEDERSYAVQLRAALDSNLGRHQEGALRLGGLQAWAEGTAHPCERAQVYNNEGWHWLLAADAASVRTDRARDDLLKRASGVLKRAHAIAETECRKTTVYGHTLVNLATLAIRLGSADTAAQWLTALDDAPTEAMDAEARTWAELMRGELALLRGTHAAALAIFKQLGARARASEQPALEWEALVGQARSHRRSGNIANAIPPLRAAEALLDGLTALVPIDSGRAAFSGDREASSRLLVQSLVELDKPLDALRVARHAHSRVLRRLFARDQLNSLSAEARKSFETALASYRTARAALDAEAGADWQRPADELERVLADRRRRLVALRATLEQALALTQPADATTAQDRPLPKGGVELMYFPGEDGWFAFLRTADGVRSAPVPTQSLTKPPPATAAGTAPYLAPFADTLKSAARVDVLEYGRVRELDLHAAPLDGIPLVHRVPVVFTVDRARTAKDASASTLPVRTLALVADPRSDLPAARTEYDRVKSKLAPLKNRPLRDLLGAQAKRSAVLDLLSTADWFHYAGHGEYAGPFGWESHLLLADKGTLSVSDILALPSSPAVVVLSGCETARRYDANAEAVSLATAFLASGSAYALATSRPIKDELATQFADGLYAHPPTSDPLAAYQAAVRALPAASDWAAFRLYSSR